MTSSQRTLCGISPKKISSRWHSKSQMNPRGTSLIFSRIKYLYDKLNHYFSPGKSSSRQSGSGSGFSFQNALIGQQDMSKFYRTSTTQKIFGMVSKLCEIGELCFMRWEYLDYTNILYFKRTPFDMFTPPIMMILQRVKVNTSSTHL